MLIIELKNFHAPLSKLYYQKLHAFCIKDYYKDHAKPRKFALKFNLSYLPKKIIYFDINVIICLCSHYVNKNYSILLKTIL